MHCERYQDDIHGLIDGSLDPAARRDLEGHLRTCDDCAAMADDLRRVRALAGSLESVGGWNDPDLLAVLVDQAHLGYADPLVDPSLIALRRSAVETRDRH